MKKQFKVCLPFDNLQGHFSCGHLEIMVQAETAEKAIELAKEEKDFVLVVDAWEVSDYGGKERKEAEAEEV